MAGKPNASIKMTVRLWKRRKGFPRVMAVGAKRAAGRIIVERVIIGNLAVAADATVVVKLSAAALINNSMRFVFIG